MTVPVFDMTDTWTDGGTTYTDIKMNVTNTASATASKLLDLQVGSALAFAVTREGKLSLAGGSTITTPGVGASGGSYTWDFSSQNFNITGVSAGSATIQFPAVTVQSTV